MAGIVCPIEPHELDKGMRRGFEDLVSRVVRVESERGHGHDLLLRVFLAGIHVGNIATIQNCSKQAAADGDSNG